MNNKKMQYEASDEFDVLAYMRSIAPVKAEHPEIILLSEWNDYWMKNYCNSIKETTLEAYHDVVTLHINRVLGKVKLMELSGEDVQHFINSLHMGVGITEPLSAKSIKNIHGILHKSLEIAVQNKYISKNPATNTILPKCEKPEIHPFNTNELRHFLCSVKGHEKEPLFIVAVFTGLREGELMGMTWDCIDFENGSLHVYRQLVKKKMDIILAV